MVIFKNKLRAGGGSVAYYRLFHNISGSIDFRCGNMKYGKIRFISIFYGTSLKNCKNRPFELFLFHRIEAYYNLR